MIEARTRKMTVIAQDPGVLRDGRILTAPVSVPWENLEPGPIGCRVCVVDYDASTQKMYKPAAVGEDALIAKPKGNADLLGDPGFHARNVYALVMRTLARFEYALGRRVGWGFRAHQLKVVPHAFEEMNAFYSREDESLMFGYYRTGNGVAFTCLSHDVVVHETSHALLDGLRKSFMAPSSPDQAAFHEAFGDIVALLSVFSLGDVLETLLEHRAEDGEERREGLIAKGRVSMESLMDSVLLGLAEEMGAEAGSARTGALRRSVRLEPNESVLDDPEFEEAHRRGEILVAAVMRTFVDAWTRRLDSLGTIEGDYLDLGRVAEEGATIAEILLTMAIRAIDYTPPIHIEFGDYLSALVTADSEIRSDDSRYGLRKGLLDWFGRYGVKPASGTEDGKWLPPDRPLRYDGVRFQSLQTDPIEMFALLWSNRKRLRLDPSAYTRVTSVRPCVRTSPEDGLPLRETVAECIHYLALKAHELDQFGLAKPAEMPDDQDVTLEGGSTLILDEYGGLKYEIYNRLPRRGAAGENTRAQARLQHLWENGGFAPGRSFNSRFATLHRRRVGLDEREAREEVW
jgi:hypothetical protein